jgi:hypothetical protein
MIGDRRAVGEQRASACTSSSGPIAFTRRLSSRTAASSFPQRSPECSTPALFTSRSMGASSRTSGSSRASSPRDFSDATSSGSTCNRPGYSPASVFSDVALRDLHARAIAA